MDPQDDVLADKIMGFLNRDAAPGRETAIRQDGQGRYCIETDAGASFTFEIHGATRLEIARRYFDLLRSVASYAVEHVRSGSWLDGGRAFTDEEKKAATRRLAELDAWAAANLPQ